MFKRLFNRKTKNSYETNGHYDHGNTQLIELRDVVKNYETAAGVFSALKGVDLQVDKGEFVAVVGKSGSGKSTLINMITGIDRPTSGEVLVGDTAVHTLSEGQLASWRGRNMGVIFQFFQLLPTLTVLENVMLPMDFCNMYPARERAERAMHFLDQVEMTEHADKLPSATSGGQQQRVAIARALANDPPILVADEPTGNLDSKTADAIFALFQDLVSQGKTILMVTHDTDLADQANRTVVVTDGELDVESVREMMLADLPDLPANHDASTEPAVLSDPIFAVAAGETDATAAEPLALADGAQTDMPTNHDASADTSGGTEQAIVVIDGEADEDTALVEVVPENIPSNDEMQPEKSIETLAPSEDIIALPESGVFHNPLADIDSDSDPLDA